MARRTPINARAKNTSGEYIEINSEEQVKKWDELRERTLAEKAASETANENTEQEPEQPTENIVEPAAQPVEIPAESPVEEQVEIAAEKTGEPKLEKSSVEKNIEIDPSLKRKGLDFTDSLNRVSGKLGTIDREAEVVSSGTISKFRNATRNLEDTFQRSNLDLK